MKKKLVVVLVLLALILTACGANPVERLEEAAAEQIAETIIEQASGIDDIEINTDDNSISYTVEDDDGNSSTFSSASSENLDRLVGLGFDIKLPDGIGNGTVQHAAENGEELVVSGVFEVDGLTIEQFLSELHPTVTAAGFTFVDSSESGKTEPDPSDPMAVMTSYEHPDGVTLSVLWGDTSVVLGLVKVEVSGDSGADGTGTESSEVSGTDTSDDTVATFDGSMNLDKKSYAINEAIAVTLIINTPLADNAWVGIVPSDTPHGSESENDAVDVTYAYVRDAQDGILMLNAPSDAGNYDVRIFNTDSDGVELDSISITVGG